MKYMEITFVDGITNIVDIFETVAIYRDDDNELYVIINGEAFYYKFIDTMILYTKSCATTFCVYGITALKKGEKVTLLDVCDEVDTEILGCY